MANAPFSRELRATTRQHMSLNVSPDMLRLIENYRRAEYERTGDKVSRQEVVERLIWEGMKALDITGAK